jgi:hypothetical protein
MAGVFAEGFRETKDGVPYGLNLEGKSQCLQLGHTGHQWNIQWDLTDIVNDQTL